MNSISIIASASMAFLLCAAPVVAQEENESFSNWDEIVRGLETNVSQIPGPEPIADDYGFDDIQISAGVGFSFTYLSLSGDPAYEAAGLLKGVALQFGIDLFHPEIQAEGAFRNYTSDSLSKRVNAQAREFELRLVHSKRMAHATRFRIGTGLAARYLDINSRDQFGEVISRKDSSPSAVFLLGFGRQFGKNLSLGPDLSYRTSLSGEALDKNSLDLHLKASAVF